MKYNLRKILKEFKEEVYNTSEPSADHMSIFEKKLTAMDMNKNRLVYSLLKYAASVILILGISVIIWLARNPQNGTNIYVFNENEELIETEQYYKALLHEKYSELDMLSAKSKNLNLWEVKKDLKEFDHDIRRLKKDWQLNPGDERIANTVISSYILHLETLEQIIELSKRT